MAGFGSTVYGGDARTGFWSGVAPRKSAWCSARAVWRFGSLLWVMEKKAPEWYFSLGNHWSSLTRLVVPFSKTVKNGLEGAKGENGAAWSAIFRGARFFSDQKISPAGFI